MKTPLFMDRVLIFPFPSTKTAISMDNKKPSAKLEFTYALLYKISFFMSESPAVAPGAIVIVALPV